MNDGQSLQSIDQLKQKFKEKYSQIKKSLGQKEINENFNK
jgi:hypothetical protein